MKKIVIKNEEQIAGIRASCKLAAQTLDFIEPHVKSGVTTLHLDDLIHEFICDNKAVPAPLNYHGFPKSSCISPNDVVTHGVPSEKVVLKDGDIVNIDITTILNGYYGDTSRMFEVGEVSESALDLIDTTWECLDLAIREVKPGVPFGQLGYVITRHATRHGYNVVDEYTGHGVGIDFHEPPHVHHFITKVKAKPIILPGMIFTIEPMINEGVRKSVLDKSDGWTARTKDGKLSAQFEQTILVTEGGFEVLTDLRGEFGQPDIEVS